MARYEDFTFDQGSDIGMELRLINEDKTPKNLTGYSVAAKLSPNYAATDSDKTNFSAFVASPATDGIVTLTLTNEQTDALKPRRRYVYDVEIFFQTVNFRGGFYENFPFFLVKRHDYTQG